MKNFFTKRFSPICALAVSVLLLGGGGCSDDDTEPVVGSKGGSRTLYVASDAGSRTVRVKANSAWQVRLTPDTRLWVSIDGADSGEMDGAFTVSYKTNNTLPRKGTVLIASGTQQAIDTVYLMQYGTAPLLQFSDGDRQFSSVGTIDSIAIDTNIPISKFSKIACQVTYGESDTEWIDSIRYAGDYKSLLFRIADNTAFESREARIQLQFEDDWGGQHLTSCTIRQGIPGGTSDTREVTFADLRSLIAEAEGEITIDGKAVSFKAPFRRVTMTEAIREKTGYDITGQSEEQLREACRRLGVEVDETMGKGKLIDAIFGQYCEEELIQPTFVCDYPIEMSPLCKRHRDNPDLTERFELFVNGKELCNAYSELNDPIDQLERFQEQLRLLEKGDDEAMFIDMDFVRALEYGMPSCSGMGIGIDRLTMFLTGQSSIQDVLFFPQMRPEKKVQRDPDEAYAAIGVPAEWIPVIQKMGYLTVDALRKLPAGKFFNDLCGFNKKNKLGLKAPSIEEVKAWCAPAAE